eukprot:3164945-Pyramimonas_sp.AAC.1
MFSDEDVDADELDQGVRRRVHVGGARPEDEKRGAPAAVAESRRLSAEAMALSTRARGREAGGDERSKRGAWARAGGRVEVPED